MKTLYLVDASIYVFRSYFSIPMNFHSREGELVNAVYGYTQFLLDLIDRKPGYTSVAFDESLVSCYRNQIFPDYKANRDLPDENLEHQLAQCQRVTSLLGFHTLCLKNYEADDIIGTLMAKVGKNRECIIVTRDKDLGQLLREGDRLWDFAADSYTDAEGVFAKFGVYPHQIADFLALAGDSVDNIPGAPGIGPKTAAMLITHFGSLDSLLARIDEVADMEIRGAARLMSILAEHADDINMYRQITSIHCDVPMAVKLSDLKLTPAPPEELLAFCDDMDFGQRIRNRIVALA